MLPSHLLKCLCLATFLVLPAQAATSAATSGNASPAGVCASLTTCEAEVDRAVADNDTESLAMALWGKIAVLEQVGKKDEAQAARSYLVAVLSQAYGSEHADTVAARRVAPEVGMQALLPAWQQRQKENTALAARRGSILDRLRAGKNMVKIAEAYFEIGKFEVTQAEWDAVMGTDPSHFKGCAACPVENIDGDTVRAFLTRLNQLTGKAYRLPTAKEWQHAYNAGFSGTLDDNAWHVGNAGGRPHPVGQKNPNALGLYDLKGNVSEWVEETHGTRSTRDDYLKAAGATWEGDAPEGFWNWVRPTAPRFPTLGFRLAHSLESPPEPKKALPACHDLADAPKPEAPTPLLASAALPANLPRGFCDCPDCPEMVTLPAGRYMDDNGKKAKMPAFAIARTEITVGQFRRFIEATGYRTSAEFNRRCNGPDQDWRRPGYAQTDAHPVVCVSGPDIKAYVDWLSTLTGLAYSIPTNPQWEYAARANSPNSAIWGDDIATACRYANLADRCFEAGIPEEMNARADFPCNDGYVHPTPLGRFPPNDFGLYDMIGNVEEWTEDPICVSYYCGGKLRVRGGGSRSGPARASFYSVTNPGDEAFPDIGFRPVRIAPH